ncbi:hypothetical protein G8O24_10110 [Bradyrhizobium sp. INPA01-394B]|uniref:Uncharacterized protein n=1 Tax=Bradyrhizobium campsiandrae TaxID=1729892 RepID=A0ABR7U4A3_9BRAD|nr:hypothetical protein [Bradyrhizobium campsiandrae]MBC9877693.1 hypothetical protein [Bradyrhizobium campsiandrae]MBC9978222.1 hypothetical protein [Bradyrhizobium campsiandrae]
MLIEQQAMRGCRTLTAQTYARVASLRPGRLLLVMALSSFAVFAVEASRAEAPKARIVGLGATTCQRFNDDVKANPVLRRDYLAWAQGFMSGIILSRPPGVDEGLDLNPVTFDLINQLHFLEDHCARNVSLDFSDAVEALYKRLRQEGKT